MVAQFKTHVLPILETVTAAVYQAPESTLSKLQHVQDSCLLMLGVDPRTAFLHFNLAPLSTRRDIAMLGFLHKCAWNRVSLSASELFPVRHVPVRRSSRVANRAHDMGLLKRCDGHHLDIMKNGLFGLVEIFNRLREGIVRSETV